MRGKHSGKAITSGEKQAEAVRLRIAGHTFDSIAEQLGYKTRAGAFKAVKTALQKTLQEPSDELRKLEVERMDAMIYAIWDDVEAGQGWAMDRVLKIMERRARLLGLDQPAKVDVTSGGERLKITWPELEGEDVGDDSDG